jgi:hypothetical protein
MKKDTQKKQKKAKKVEEKKQETKLNLNELLNTSAFDKLDLETIETKEVSERVREEAIDSILAQLAEEKEIELTKKEWIEIVTTLSDKDYAELYQTLNEFLNTALNTKRFKMGEKRTLVLGKLTKRVLITIFPKLKPVHLLAGAILLCYVPPSIFVVIDKIRERKRKKEQEAQHGISDFERFARTERKAKEGKKSK